MPRVFVEAETTLCVTCAKCYAHMGCVWITQGEPRTDWTATPQNIECKRSSKDRGRTLLSFAVEQCPGYEPDGERVPFGYQGEQARRENVYICGYGDLYYVGRDRASK